MKRLISIVPVVFCFSGVICHEDDQFDKYMQAALSQGLDLFSGLNKVLKYLRDNETNALSRKILETFEKECIHKEEPVQPEGVLRKPFIVIEGNHRPSKDVVAMRQAKLMGRRYLAHPAPCLAKYLDVLPSGSLLRRTFYMLSLYWLEQLVFHLIQSFPAGSLPPASSNIFNFSEGLLKPDLIIYLNLPDSLKFRGMTTKSPLNWKPRSLSLYKDLQSRFPIKIETLTGKYRSTVNSIYQLIYDNLSDTRNILAFRRHTLD